MLIALSRLRDIAVLKINALGDITHSFVLSLEA